MSIATEAQRIKNGVASAFNAAEAKGATMPTVKNVNALPACIESIPVTSVTSVVTDAFKNKDVLAAMQSVYNTSYPNMIGYMLDTKATSVIIPMTADRVICSDGAEYFNKNGSVTIATIQDQSYKFIILCFTTANKTQPLVPIGSAEELVTVSVVGMYMSSISGFTAYNRIYRFLFDANSRISGDILAFAFGSMSYMLYDLDLPPASVPFIANANAFNNDNKIRKLNLSLCTSVGAYCCASMSALKELYLGKLTSLASGFIQGCLSLEYLVVGIGTDIALNFSQWDATYVNVATLATKIELGISDRVANMVGKTSPTITFSTYNRNAIRGTAAESKLIAKNWSISPA